LIDENPARSFGIEPPGVGVLRFVRAGGRTVIHTARARSPLRLLLPCNHGDAAWVFVASLGGGLVDGDALALSVDVDEGASALLGTQASTKVYCSPHGTSQALRAHVRRGGMLAIVPDPVSCFAGARYEQRIEVDLEDGSATLVLLDAFTCGRAARGERWSLARYASRTRVAVSGRTLAFDSVLLDPTHGDLRVRMGRFEAFASILAVGPRASDLRAGLLAAAVEASPRGAPRLLAATVLSDGATMGRVAATSAHESLAAVRPLLAPLARELGDDPFARRW
jgi:urease accessory protein